jgi:hypothetical protein
MKCFCCGKKMNELLSFKCKCGRYFCNKHRYPDHKCRFDVVNYNKMQIFENNPKIKRSKLKFII